MNKIDLCLQIAVKAHEGQIDKNGEPYILHPIAVGMMGNTDEEKMVGFLHDVVEDTDWTFEQLLEAGVHEDVVGALRLLTHEDPKERLSEEEFYAHYIAYVQRIIDSRNTIALKVKRNDLTHNLSRANSNEHFRRKYEPALALVSRALEQKTKEIDNSYYIYKEHFLAKGNFSKGFLWFNNGQWVEDDNKTLGLRDSMMDFGDASSFDYINISEEWAEKLILNGMVVLEGKVSSSEYICKPLVINLIDWKKPMCGK